MIFEKNIADIYRGMAYVRYDDNKTAFYFSADDFAGLNKEPYRFKSSRGHSLQGYLYFYDNPVKDRLVVFEHGMGGGHRSYMKEIEKLCGHGFSVFAYDHTGCMESEGSSANGMAQSLCDLNDCITALKNDARFADADISVIGHSWGGFSALNIPAFHPEISHIVALSGYVSVQHLVNSFFGGILKGYRKTVMGIERASNPDFADCNAVNSLANANTKVLLICSDNDKICRRAVNYDAVKAGLEGHKNIETVLVPNKGHNPNYTEDAVAYLGQYASALKKKLKKRQLETDGQKHEFLALWDWDRMTAQDDTVWNKIFEFLDK